MLLDGEVEDVELGHGHMNVVRLRFARVLDAKLDRIALCLVAIFSARL